MCEQAVPSPSVQWARPRSRRRSVLRPAGIARSSRLHPSIFDFTAVANFYPILVAGEVDRGVLVMVTVPFSGPAWHLRLPTVSPASVFFLPFVINELTLAVHYDYYFLHQNAPGSARAALTQEPCFATSPRRCSRPPRSHQWESTVRPSKVARGSPSRKALVMPGTSIVPAVVSTSMPTAAAASLIWGADAPQGVAKTVGV